MWQRKYLTVDLIHIKFTWLLFSKNYAPFSHLILPPQSNFRNAPANSNGNFTMTSIKILNPFQSPHLFQPKHHGISAKNLIAMNQTNFGK